MIDKIIGAYHRYCQLVRGHYWRLRGVKAGIRFGVGRGVDIRAPDHLAVGNDVSIQDYCFLDCSSPRGIVLGDWVSIERNSWLHCGNSGYIKIENNTFIGCNCVIGAGGGVTIGEHVLIGQTVNFHAENHNFERLDQLIDLQGVALKEIIVAGNVWIGSQTVILGGVSIESGAVIGAGAVVTQDVPYNAVVGGVPAKVIKTRGSGEVRNTT